jgi:ABC-2 type transport system ATP-binding protein
MAAVSRRFSPLTESPLLTVERALRCRGAQRVLDQVSLTLGAGRVLALLGINGAGKSTLLRAIAGLLALDAGRIQVAGVDLSDDPRAARRLIGYLPERPPLYPELSVREYLAFVATLRGLPRADAARATMTTVERCDLGEVRDRLCGRLSRGFQQRVGLAQALLHAPALLLLDEPTSGLDPLQSERLHAIVRELRGKTAVILSTHQLDEAEALADEIAILHRGRLRHHAAAGAVPLAERFLAIALRKSETEAAA